MIAQDIMEELRYVNPDDEVLVIDKQGIEHYVSEVFAENGKLYLQIDD